jgi:hypothetical protein
MPEPCWHQESADTRATLTPEQFISHPAQQQIEKALRLWGCTEPSMSTRVQPARLAALTLFRLSHQAPRVLSLHHCSRFRQSFSPMLHTGTYCGSTRLYTENHQLLFQTQSSTALLSENLAIHYAMDISFANKSKMALFDLGSEEQW